MPWNTSRPRVQLVDIVVERDEHARAINAYAVVEAAGGGGRDNRGFLFGARPLPPLEPGEVYTLEPDPNDINGFWQAKVTDGLIEGGDLKVAGVRAGAGRLARRWSGSARGRSPGPSTGDRPSPPWSRRKSSTLSTIFWSGRRRVTATKDARRRWLQSR